MNVWLQNAVTEPILDCRQNKKRMFGKDEEGLAIILEKSNNKKKNFSSSSSFFPFSLVEAQ